MKDTVTEIIEALQELKDAQSLLDDILAHYDVYSGQFDIPDYETGRVYKESVATGQWHLTLNRRIRSYLKFDDSE